MRKPLVLITVGIVIGALVFFQNCGRGPVEGAAKLASTGPQVQEIPVIPPDHPPVDTQTPQKTTYSPLLADRYYLQSLFTDVFGPTAGSISTANIFTDVVSNGAPCDLYEDYNATTTVRGNSMEICTARSSNRLTGQVTPSPTVTREAQLAHACSDLTTNDTTMAYALVKMGATLPTMPGATIANLKAAFALFYRNSAEPSDALLQSLGLMLTPDAPTLDEWRSVIYTICVSPQWQIL